MQDGRTEHPQSSPDVWEYSYGGYTVKSLRDLFDTMDDPNAGSASIALGKNAFEVVDAQYLQRGWELFTTMTAPAADGRIDVMFVMRRPKVR